MREGRKEGGRNEIKMKKTNKLGSPHLSQLPNCILLSFPLLLILVQDFSYI